MAGCLFLPALGPASADTGGRFPLPELVGTITIDDEDAAAVCSDGDWPAGAGDFLELPLTQLVAPDGPTGSGKMLIFHPDDPLADQEMYLFFSIGDNTPDTAINIDNLVVMFDLSHDHVVADTSSFENSDDRGIQFNRDGTVQRIFGNLLTPTLDATPVSDSRTCVSEDGLTGWAVEAQLIPSDIGLNSFNALMGAAVLADDRDTGSSAFSNWPSTAVPDPATWSNLITRPPIDFVLLIDQSGSMSGDKWDSAKRAGNHFRAILDALRDDALASEFSALGVTGGGDRLGLSVFTTNVAGNADTVDALDDIALQPTDYTAALPLSPSGGTPMAAGVNETFDMFRGAANLGDPALTVPANVFRRQVVMMLSDGRHNTPSTTLDFSNAGVDFDYLPATPDCHLQLALNSLVRINTVAVGTDATVDTAKLDQIKDCFSGDRYTNAYNIAALNEAELTAQLTRFYFETIFPYYHLNVVNDTGANFDINAGERRLLLFAFWPDTSAATSLAITEPDASVNSGSTCPVGLGYCFLVIDNPDPGSYTNFDAPGAAGEFVLLDLNTEARFGIDNLPHGTSSTITLRGRLLEAGQPITGAQVRVEAARPEEGFGTFASTHLQDGCEEVEPRLPDIKFDPRIRLGRQTLGPVTGVPATQPSTQSGDTNPPAFALMESLLENCGKEGLDRAVDGGLQLFDDGTNGDETADDGYYTLVFDNTEFEGSYVFRFTATGTASDGLPFTRVQEVGEYVRVDVDPAQTVVGSRVLQQLDTLVFQEYNLLPRDAGGQYLGPGHADQVAFLASGGQWFGPVRDYNNGYYARILAFDPRRGEPVVTPVVQGQPILPTVDPDDKDDWMDAFAPWWWICLIVIIVLLILILLLWLRVQQLKDRISP